MEEFLDGLVSMLLQFRVDPENTQAVPVFAVSCAIIGAAAVFMDLALFAVRGKSLLGLRHGTKNTFIFMVAWVFGSLIVGYMAQLMSMFQYNVAACAVVGFTWPLVATMIVEKVKDQEIAQEPEQELNLEE